MIQEEPIQNAMCKSNASLNGQLGELSVCQPNVREAEARQGKHEVNHPKASERPACQERGQALLFYLGRLGVGMNKFNQSSCSCPLRG